MTAMRCTLCGWVDSHDPACMWIGPRDPAYLVPISDEEAEARLSVADLRAALVVVREQLTRAQAEVTIQRLRAGG